MMDSFSELIKKESLQDRINRMNAWKEAQQKADKEKNRRQRIRIFINDCDDIRPALRNQLLIDSKACQAEQIKDQIKREKEIKDLDDAWHEVLCRDYNNKSNNEKSTNNKRRLVGLAVQDYLKSQMYEKKLADYQKMHDEINLELEQISIQKKQEEKEDLERMKKEQIRRKMLKEETLKQIAMNEELRKRDRKMELEIEKFLNKNIEDEMKRQENLERSEKEHFRREVFQYLDYLHKTKHLNDIEERKKEKLVDDIIRKKNEHEWVNRCEFINKRALVNKEARAIQVHQMMEQEKTKIEEAAKEKEENLRFNQHELNERTKIREEKWMSRLKGHHYGQQLLNQKKMEQLRDLEVKQKLDEQLKLVAIERDQWETMGREFVNSYEDVLPIHYNLRAIRKAKH